MYDALAQSQVGVFRMRGAPATRGRRREEVFMYPRDAIDGVLGSLQQAMLDDAHWPAAMARIDEVCGLGGSGLVIADGYGDDVQVHAARFYHRGERRPGSEREYFEVYYPLDERVPRLRDLPSGQLMHVPDMYTEEEKKTSPVYNEGLPRLNAQRGLNVRFDGPDGLRIVWATDDPVGGGWQSAQLERIHYLLPHIHHAVLVRQALAASDALGAGLAGLLDTGRVGVIQLDRRGRIVEANGRALSILRGGDGLSDHDGALHAWLAEDTGRLRKLLKRALPTLHGESPAGGSMTVRRPDGQTRLGLHVSPVGSAQAAFDGLRVAALVLVVDPASRPHVDAGRVATVLGLTPSEGRASALLAEGRSVRDIASVTGWQENYARWLLKQVYKKQGVSGQAALVGLVLAADSLPRR